MGVSETASPTTFTTADASPSADPFAIDHELRDLVAPAFRFLHERYWRVEVTGAEHVPAEGPVLLVANHSGALPFDGAMIIASVQIERGRAVSFLFDRLIEGVPTLVAFYRKVGGVVESRRSH